MSIAYLLVAHGSRDPRPQIALERLTYLVGATEQIPRRPAVAAAWEAVKSASPVALAVKAPAKSQPAPLLFQACLELQPQSLRETLTELGGLLAANGIRRLVILPLFLLAGVHVCEDLPVEIAQAQSNLGDRLTLHCLPHLGQSPALIPLLEQRFQHYQTTPACQRILLAHGSRRQSGNQDIEQLAIALGATAAYCKSTPSLDTVLTQFAPQSPLVIVPYFLFSGGLTDWVRDQIQTFQSNHPNALLQLGEPLGATPELAKLIAQSLFAAKSVTND